MPRKFSSKYFNKGESVGRMQATFRKKFREINDLITTISDLEEVAAEFIDPATYASYVVSELLNCTVTDKCSNFFDSENTKDSLLEDFSNGVRDCLLQFVTDNKAYFENSEDTHIQNLCGDFYRYGCGFEKDDSKAVEKYFAASSEDYYPALKNLLECYEEEIGVTTIDPTTIKEIREKITEKDYHIVSVSSGGVEERSQDSRIGKEISFDDDETVISDLTGSESPPPISRSASTESLNEPKLNILRGTPATI